MNMLRDRCVLVLGLGISGLAMLRWCAGQGARVHAADSRAAPPGLETARQEFPQARLQAGAAGVELLDGVDLVCVSPGIAPDDAAFGALLRAARERGIELRGELSLFAQALGDLHDAQGYAPALIGITGTNGKTTVTTLTTLLLQAAGQDAVAAGNIGPAMLDVLGQRLREQRLPRAWVLELSSFQLHGVDDFAASAATVLNLTQDHLDWHGGMQAYAADKARVFGPQPWNLRGAPGLMLLNRDDAAVLAMRREGRRACSFGLDAPRADGDWGIVREHGMDWLARARADDSEPRPAPRRGRVAAPAEALPVQVQALMPADALRIRGRHNQANALASLALAASTGAALAPMLHALREYRGEPHRMQSLGVLDGVEWIEDSKGTNVGATVAALQGLDRPALLIAGGDGKGQDFAPLAQAARDRVRCALLIGRDAPALRQALGSGVDSEMLPDLRAAVRRAAELARSGEVVLLSPACASLDMFRDYKHRAEVFAQELAELAAERGAVLEGAP
ncbi:UDP-N-acetylmuramoyl-L-alanine--D-glutamate ligase [Thiomonas sp. FB-6]|uniref:UDP-N-acetylmuramoyl-L-alanine--D-glutamate ligase n=1 Tax=Thiomonas sp. FB-6 TaxID=1158291 RepID=UPI00036FF3A4|nr:UDP-N-acetylmuramoyl-L-alanine--D-glutamate ligase [Thiomonas sp. FB-6]